MSADDLQKQLDDVENLVRVVRGMERAPAASGVGNAQISINAGGAAVWAAVTACVATVAAVMVAAVFVAITIADLRQTDRELREADMVTQAYLSTQIPPKEEEPRE